MENQSHIHALVIANLMRTGDPAPGDLPEPWLTIAGEIGQKPAGIERAKAFESVIAGLNGNVTEIRSAVYAAIRELDSDIPHGKASLGKKRSKSDTQRAKSIVPQPPDPETRERIQNALLEQYAEHRHLVEIRRGNAGRLLLEWLGEHGGFVRDEADNLYYFYTDTRRLFALDTNHWAAWLYAVSGANPASTHFNYLLADCQAAALNAEIKPIVRVAAWDNERQVLRISAFNGTVHVLNGETITQEANGQTIIFHDNPNWMPYEPNFDDTGELDWLTFQIPHWNCEPQSEMLYGLAFRYWLLSTFFTELCPSRPFVVMHGEAGSGKSTLLRLMLRLLFGPLAEVTGVPDKPDSFVAAASVAHILILDNLDDFTPWLRDKLARIATGAKDTIRRLYSNNTATDIVYRCWLGITARTPDTLKRDDIADRMLMLPTKRFDSDHRTRELELFSVIEFYRNGFWADVLRMLNQVVRHIRTHGFSTTSQLRMADWEALCRVFAVNEGREGDWDRLCDMIRGEQSQFILQDDLLVEGIVRWMLDESNHGRAITAYDLQKELTALMFDDKRPPPDWPKSTIGFGRRLGNIRRDLCQLYDVSWRTGRGRGQHNQAIYNFWLKGTMPQQFSMGEMLTSV